MTEKPTTNLTEEELMVTTWRKFKTDLYEKGHDKLDANAKSLVTLSSALITVGFTVIGAMVGNEILTASAISLWIALLGFGCFMVSTISNILVIFRRPTGITQLSKPPVISAEWDRIRAIKYRYLKIAYSFFGLGVILVTISLFSLILLG
jgi:hypothetical protein